MQVTAISGSLYGNFTSIEYLNNGSYERVSYSVSGAYDNSQISVVIEGFLETQVLTGTWDSGGIYVTWPSVDGTISNAHLAPITDYAAERVVELWPKHTARQANIDLVLPMMERVSASSSWESTDAERVFADQAASYVGIPSNDAMDLLISGWLASAHFSDQAPDSLPNQINWYTIHVFSTPAEAMRAASCWMDANGLIEKDFARAESPFDSVLLLNSQSEEDTTISSIVAIHGSNLITAKAYGDDSVEDHASGLVVRIIQDIGAAR